jgi:ribonuclease E
MPKQIIIAEQHRIAAVFSEDQIQELIVATGNHQVGDIYLGVVENVLPGIDAAFVNIGDPERNGFIHVSDLGPLRLRRSAGSITELLAPQQKVLVQVMKEPTGNKGPRLTGNISLPGRYLVLMPFGRGVNLSRRIRNENERNRLRALAILVKPAGMGLLVRTEAEGVSEEAVIEDLEALQKQWEGIQQEAIATRPPKLLNRDDDFIQRVLRDVYSADVNRIVVDSHTGVKRVKQHLMNWSSGRPPQGVLIDHHRDRISILEYFRVNAAIREALKPRVDLPSGGYIIIERTEALTVIDVNSGSFTRSSTARETVLWTNCEAATEIARQLRLRNIAGVIVVDFIDMDSRRDQLQVLEHFNKSLRADKARPQIAQLTELGLVELTRKRQGKNIYELFGQACPTCSGLGHVVHLPGETESLSVEPFEPVRPAPILPRVAHLQPTWDEPAEDLEGEFSPDPQELNLINHPNYQERGKTDNRRRRRSRTRLGEPVIKGMSPRSEYEYEAEESVAEEAPVSLTPTLIPKENRPEKVERGNRTSRREKPSSDPAQVVSVEMTPEEQDVYAFMGVSPLVLATEPIKDPKSAVVTVTLPGQSTRSGNGSISPPVPKPKSLAEAVLSAYEAPANELPTSTEETDSSPPLEDIDLQPPFTPSEAAVLEIQTSEVEQDDENGLFARRRRRRRSSVGNSESNHDLEN